MELEFVDSMCVCAKFLSQWRELGEILRWKELFRELYAIVSTASVSARAISTLY